MRAVSMSIAVAVALAGCSREEPAGAMVDPTRPATSAPVTRAKAAPPRPAQLAQVTIKALGMYCEESCPMKVRYALADVTAVYELGFDVSTESIFVSYDAALGHPKQVTKPMLAAIKSTGFDPWLAKESWPPGAEAQVVWR
ncbi:MAG: heavy-metal-associated domain-containing protein [Deltaproteobacteria bacterium]|nr:heavy-metal-associated domain-containing protein [Deltaproteobacteria bacterium]MDQ3300114.1 hypothetical protein [Myxococcota bacterium]